jgi:hypothetical protein
MDTVSAILWFSVGLQSPAAAMPWHLMPLSGRATARPVFSAAPPAAS